MRYTIAQKAWQKNKKTTFISKTSFAVIGWVSALQPNKLLLLVEYVGKKLRKIRQVTVNVRNVQTLRNIWSGLLRQGSKLEPARANSKEYQRPKQAGKDILNRRRLLCPSRWLLIEECRGVQLDISQALQRIVRWRLDIDCYLKIEVI